MLKQKFELTQPQIWKCVQSKHKLFGLVLQSNSQHRIKSKNVETCAQTNDLTNFMYLLLYSTQKSGIVNWKNWNLIVEAQTQFLIGNII